MKGSLVTRFFLSRPRAPTALSRKLSPRLLAPVVFAFVLAGEGTLARADPRDLHVSVEPCAAASIDARPLLRLLRVELSDTPMTVLSGAPPSGTEGGRLVLRVTDCSRAPWSYTVALVRGGVEHVSDIDLRDVAPPQRARALALAVAELVRSASSEGPTDASASAPSRSIAGEIPRGASRRGVRRASVAAAPPWIVTASLDASCALLGDGTLRGARVGVARRVAVTSRMAIYLEADLRSRLATRSDPLGAVGLVSGELVLGARLTWPRRSGALSLGAHVAPGVQRFEGTSTRSEVESASGSVFAAWVGLDGRASVRVARRVALWSELGVAWQLGGFETRSQALDELRAVGSFTGPTILVGAGVAWEIGGDP